MNLIAVDAAGEWGCRGEEAISRSHGLEVSGKQHGPLLAKTGPLVAVNQLATRLGICLKRVSCGEDACPHLGSKEESLVSTIMRQG